RVRIMWLDRAERRLVELTKDLDRSCDTPHWEPVFKDIICSVENNGFHQLHAGYGCKPITSKYSDTSPSLSRNGVIAFSRTGFDFPAQLCVLDTRYIPDILLPAQNGRQFEKRADDFNDDL